MNINKVIIMGNLTRDPEMRALPSGMQVANLGVATNRFWTDKTGQRQKQAEFHNIVLFGRNAEIAKQYLQKGSSVFVEGRIQTRNWQAQDGQTRYKTEVVAERLQLGPRNYQNQGSQPNNNQTSQTTSNNPNDNLDVIEYPEEDINLEEIPF